MSEYGPTAPVGTADLTSRFLARLIDGVLLGVVVYGVLAGVLFSVFATGGAGFGFGYGGGFVYAFLLAVVGTGLQLAYFVYFETKGQPTIGKRLMKLEVRGPNGGPLTVEQSVRRNFFIALGLIGFVPVIGALAGLATFGAYIWIALSINGSATGQGVHDELAGGAHVVKAGQ